MEYEKIKSWAVEVLGGKPRDVTVGEDEVLYLDEVYIAEAPLGGLPDEMKKILRLEVINDGKKTVISYLHPKKWPRQYQELVFGKSFQIYHECESHTVFCVGAMMKTDQK